MHPSQPAEGSTPAPTDPMQSQDAYLADVMAQAEIAANAERDLDAENPTAASGRQEAHDADAEGDEQNDTNESVPADEAQEDEDESGDEAEGEGEQPKPTEPAEQPRYSRRDAARFKSELDSKARELESAQNQLRQFQGEVANYRSSDQTIRAHLQEQSGYVREANGRFRFENLSEKVLRGQATQEEADEVARMTSWHEFAAPIFRAAEDMVLRTIAVDWAGLKELEGVGDEGLKKLNAVPNSVQGAKELHAMAYTAGQNKAKAESEQAIAKLQAEVKSLKTKKAATSPQPASANGAAVPSRGGILARAIGPDGLSNPDFDREVASGKWLGADLAQT